MFGAYHKGCVPVNVPFGSFLSSDSLRMVLKVYRDEVRKARECYIEEFLGDCTNTTIISARVLQIVLLEMENISEGVLECIVQSM